MILLIDTAQETGIAALSKDGEVLFQEENKIQKEHASWLHMAIGRLMTAAQITVRDLEAVAVIAGPGSYTGLRVGMAAAKGFCYALKIPLITQNSLVVMAQSMTAIAEKKNALICPMIDARRQEVFTALYSLETANRQPPTANRPPPTANRPPQTANLTEILHPQALILDKTAFEWQLAEKPILFFGSGAAKWKEIINSSNALFEPQQSTIQAFAMLARHDFSAGRWADPVYSEPVYLKEFFSY